MTSVPTKERRPLLALRAHITAARSLPWGGLLAALFLLQNWSPSLSKAGEATVVRVFDTRATFQVPLSSDAICNHRNWTLVPEDSRPQFSDERGGEDEASPQELHGAQVLSDARNPPADGQESGPNGLRGEYDRAFGGTQPRLHGALHIESEGGGQ